MADNIKAVVGAGPDIATDEVSSVHYQVVKLMLGADGAATLLLAPGQAVKASSIPVTIASDQPTFPVKLGTLTPTLYVVECSTTDTEYSQALPSNCKQFDIRVRGSGFSWRLAFATGKVATLTDPYLAFNAGESFSSPIGDMGASPITLYFSLHNVAGGYMEIIAWV